MELFAARTPRGEVEWTAARILELVRREGLRFRDIGVVARSYRTYQDLVESVFARYGVPVFSSSMSEILDKPVLALVTGALDTVAGGYVYDDVFRYLKTGLTDLGEEDRDLLENYVLKWDIRGSRWTQEKPWTMHPRGYGFPMTEEDQALLERVDRARRQVAAPLERLRKNSARTGRGQAMALYGFLEEIGLPRRLGERVEELRRRGEPALAEEYRQLWEILCGGLEQCAALTGEVPMELEEFSSLFQLVLSQYDVGTIPVSLDRVTAGETTRQTGHRVKVLFLLGADDSSIPQVGAEPGLLSDDDRTLLASYGLELNQSAEERLYREMTTLYQICALPSRRLILTWPAQGAGGEERRSCFLVGRLKLLFPGLAEVREEGLGDSFRMAAPLPALELAGRSPAVRRVMGSLPEYAPPGGAAGTGRTLGAGQADPGGGGPAVWTAGTHVRLPDGQVQVLPLLLLHALRPPGGAPEACRIHCAGVRHLRPLCAGACAPELPHRGGELGGGAAKAAESGGTGGGGPLHGRGTGRVGAPEPALPLSVPPPAALRPGGGGQRGPGAVRLPIPAHFL